VVVRIAEDEMSRMTSWLLSDKGFGFIRGEDGTEYLMHRSAVRGAVFEQLHEGEHVLLMLDKVRKDREPRMCD